MALPVLDRATWVAKDIKLSHSVFAMPFALLATFMAAGYDDRWPRWEALTLIVVCMFLARTVAMTVNRWADAEIDSENPRTAGRSIPAGNVTARFMAGVAIICSVVFIFTTGAFWLLHANPWPLLLSPVALILVGGYSFTKRFTALCHLVLGIALASSPVAAVIAIEPGFLSQPDVYLLAIMVLCWVAGFDIIYALQDVDVDRRDGIFSMPSRLGIGPALWVSRGLHTISVIVLITLALTSHMLSMLFGIGVALVAGMLLLEHVIIYRSKTQHIHFVFFTLNGVISILLGLLGIGDIAVAIRG